MTTRLLIVLVFVLAIISTISVTMLATGGDSSSNSTGGVNRAEVEEIIKSYVRTNPQVVVDAFTEARRIQEEAQAEQAEQEIAARKDEIENDAGTPYAGNPDGDIVLTEFYDYSCGYCKRVIPDIITLLEEDENVKFVIKDFPILGPQSHSNALASLAVNKIAPDKFFDFHVKLLQQTPRNNDQLYALAAKLGIDPEQLKSEMEKPEHSGQIEKNLALGQAIGVRGTPAFVLNGEFIRGAVDLNYLRQRISAKRGS